MKVQCRCPRCEHINEASSLKKRDFVIRCSNCDRLVRIWKPLGAVAHLGERFAGSEEVAGSIPASSTQREDDDPAHSEDPDLQ